MKIEEHKYMKVNFLVYTPSGFTENENGEHTDNLQIVEVFSKEDGFKTYEDVANFIKREIQKNKNPSWTGYKNFYIIKTSGHPYRINWVE